MKLFNFKNIKTRLTVLFLLIALSPLAIVLTITYFNRVDIIENRSTDKLVAIRDLKVQQLNSWLDERVGDLNSMSNDNELINLGNIHHKTSFDQDDLKLLDNCSQLLNHNLNNFDSYYDFYIINPNNGKIMVSTKVDLNGVDKSTEDYFTIPMKSGELTISDVYYSKTLSEYTMSYSIPIYSKEQGKKSIVGILVARINLKASLYKLLLNRVGLGYTGETLIVDKNAIALNELRWYENAPLNLKIKAEPAVNAANGMTGIAITNDYRDESVLAAYTFIPQTNWGFVCKQDMKELNRPIEDMVWNFLIMFIIASIGAFIIARIFSISVSKPIVEMDIITQRIKDGDFSARNIVISNDELGSLANSINSTANKLSLIISTQNGVMDISEKMLSENDAKIFFQKTLRLLSEYTNSQIAAAYLLSDDHKSYEHYESIGLDTSARQSFSAEKFEGELGSAISSQKVQHIKNIPADTSFTFNTVSGKFIPREIITIPVIANNEIIAIISLASLNLYNEESIQLIDKILSILCARVEGLLAYDKIKEFSAALEHQNHELEAQKAEMASQSAELIEQNTELEMQKHQLGEASRLKTDFLSNMSHELRTPLNSVIALSGVLNRRLATLIPDEEYSYLEVIERNGKNLLLLINDILDISRIESGHVEVEITKFKMNNLVSELVNMIEPQANEKNIKLRCINCDQTISINSDETKCRHILQNLIANAVKFTEKGSVEIEITQVDQNIQVSIKDSGVGISEEHLPYIFDEFRQADGSTSRKFGGSGLGLAIARKFANLLGGTISVISTPSQGSEFILNLPIKSVAINQITDVNPARILKQKIHQLSPLSLSDLSAKTILIVEDSEPAIIQMKDIIEEIGYQTSIAHDGSEALQAIDQMLPDAIILDLMMPEIDGFEVLKTLREVEKTAHVPVLILTAKHITKEELKFLTRNNVHQLIQKGNVKRDELINAVNTMVFTEKVSPETEKLPIKLQVIEGIPKVLVVEDNPDNMITVKALLSDNFTVFEATDAKIGIEMVKTQQPNLILMDIALPGMDGIEAFKIIRSNSEFKNIPVIALTASAMVSDREIILAHGFDAYIAKPIDEKVFFKTINSVLYGE